MNIDDVARLRALVDQETDPEIKAVGKAALITILGTPVEEQKQKRREHEREETRFQIGVVGLVLGGVFFGSLYAVGAITVPSAVVSTIVVGFLSLCGALMGVKLPKLPWPRRD